MIGSNDHEPRQLAMSAGTRVQRKLTESCQFGKGLLEVEIDFEGTLTGICGLQGMESCEGLHGCNLLVDDGVVLHRAGAEGIEAVVDTEVVVAEVCVVTHDRQFIALRQTGSLLTTQRLGQLGCGVCAVVVLWQ